MPRIFLSYRHSDSPGNAGWLHDSLVQAFGDDKVFLDVDTIGPGVPFADHIASAVSACDVLLAMIGPGWLGAVDDDGNRRLDQEDDFVRLEVSAALNRHILVVPLLVNGARMPRRSELPPDLQDLAGRNAHEMSHKRWDYDVDQLLKALRNLDAPKVEAGAPEPESATMPPPPEPVGLTPVPARSGSLTSDAPTWAERMRYVHSDGWANPAAVGRWAATRARDGGAGTTAGAWVSAAGLWVVDVGYWIFGGVYIAVYLALRSNN
jgi:hypothetical protein